MELTFDPVCPNVILTIVQPINSYRIRKAMAIELSGALVLSLWKTFLVWKYQTHVWMRVNDQYLERAYEWESHVLRQWWRSIQNIKTLVLLPVRLYLCKNLKLISISFSQFFCFDRESERRERSVLQNFIPACVTTLFFHVLEFIFFYLNSWWLVPFWNNQRHIHHTLRETRLKREETWEV